MEKILQIRQLSYLDKHSLLRGFRHGFRKRKEFMIESFKNKTVAIGIYTDFSNAFNLADHHILLFKLHKYGLRGKEAHAPFKSYLTYRKHFVNIDNATSAAEATCAWAARQHIGATSLLDIMI